MTHTDKRTGVIRSRISRFVFGRFLLLSYPKCGRTWVRVFLCKYYAQRDKIPFSEKLIMPRPFNRSPYPSVYPTHLGVPPFVSFGSFLKHLGVWQTLFSWIHAIKRSRVIFLVRDPRDVVVSYYFDATRRSRTEGYASYTLGSLLRDDVFGINAIVRYMNAWYASRNRFRDFLLVRYEDLREHPEQEFRRILSFLSSEPINEDAFTAALEFSSFDQMRAMERAGKMGRNIRPGDAADEDSYKVRRGVVGGFRSHFTEADMRFADEAVSKLDPELGYNLGQNNSAHNASSQ